MKKVAYFYIVLLMLIVAFGCLAGINAGEHPCVEKHRVISILSVHYPKTDVQLDDASIVSVNQREVNPNDLFCTKYK